MAWGVGSVVIKKTLKNPYPQAGEGLGLELENWLRFVGVAKIQPSANLHVEHLCHPSSAISGWSCGTSSSSYRITRVATSQLQLQQGNYFHDSI